MVQKFHYGEDRDIWVLNVEDKEKLLLLPLPREGVVYWLKDGLRIGKSFLFILGRTFTSYILEYRDGKALRLLKVEESPNSVRFIVRDASERRVLFLLRKGSENPLFVYDSSGLKKVSDIPEVYDVLIHPKSQKICIMLNVNDQRHLIVKEYKLTESGKDFLLSQRTRPGKQILR